MKRIFTFLLIIFSVIVFHSFYISKAENKSVGATILDAFDNLRHLEFYEALANPTVAYIKIPEGYRKEQIASIFEKRFGWDEKEKSDFFAYDYLRDRKHEGKYFPDVYLVPKTITGTDMRNQMAEKFDTTLEDLKTEALKKNVNFESIITIASIIERETGGKSDMRLISGVIWNRLYLGMKLQMDATLQYAKGTEENKWWPHVTPSDKQIESPYNTYTNVGLPPSPIANPGLASIEAALTPLKTKCLFYFHKDKKIYCSQTYEEHKRKIDLYLK